MTAGASMPDAVTPAAQPPQPVPSGPDGLVERINREAQVVSVQDRVADIARYFNFSEQERMAEQARIARLDPAALDAARHAYDAVLQYVRVMSDDRSARREAIRRRADLLAFYKKYGYAEAPDRAGPAKS